MEVHKGGHGYSSWWARCEGPKWCLTSPSSDQDPRAFNQTVTPAASAEIVRCQITVLLSPQWAVSCGPVSVMVKCCFRSDFPRGCALGSEWSLFKSTHANVPALPVSDCFVTMAAVKVFLPSCDCQLKGV